MSSPVPTGTQVLLTTGEELSSIASVIKTRTGTATTTYLSYPDGFITGINNITGYSIEFNITGMIVEKCSPAMLGGECTIVFKPDLESGYVVPQSSADFTISEKTASIKSYDESTATLIINNITGNITIAATGTQPLCFTANTANSTVGLQVTGTLTQSQAAQYSTNGKEWINIETLSTTNLATLTNIGDKVFIRSLNAINTTWSESNNVFICFTMSGSIAASGNVNSLLSKNCTSTTIPASYCFSRLFRNCTSLTTAPALPATTLADYCYYYMFNDCSSLITAPELPATTLTTRCYSHMFYKCISLTTTPALPATTLAEDCYRSMFSGCKSLVCIPKLPATEMKENCYSYMFNACRSLQASSSSTEAATKIWYIPAGSRNKFTNSNQYTMSGMFTACDGTRTSNAVTATQNTQYTFYTQHIPIPDGIEPLCFTANTAGSTVSMTKTGSPADISLEYSTDKTTWNIFTVDSTTVTLTNIGDKVYFRGTNSSFSTNISNYYKFVMTGSISADGSIMTLLDKYDNIRDLTDYGDYCFNNLFNGCTSLTTAPVLPATTLANYCYDEMFNGCTSLTTAPALPATTLAQSCYLGMFNGCTSLTTAPALPATTLAQSCYQFMFYNCTSLTIAPALSATKLTISCYYCMFNGCTSLTTAPALPATTLAQSCYYCMFYNCTSLTTAPALPATTLAQGCYLSMFSGCSSLTTAPALPATTLAQDCYQFMFYNCTKLYVYNTSDTGHKKTWRIPTTGNASSYTTQTGMFYGTTGNYAATSTVTLNSTFYTQNTPVS